jgi:hypothetical protein
LGRGKVENEREREKREQTRSEPGRDQAPSPISQSLTFLTESVRKSEKLVREDRGWGKEPL